MIYLDSAATSFLKPKTVEEAVLKAFHTMGNPGRGAHEPTLQASRMVYDTRCRLAKFFGAKDPGRIAFTSNVTEALNLAIAGLPAGGHIVTTCCEHNSVLRPLYQKECAGTELTILDADICGVVTPEQIAGAIRPDTTAVVIHHGSNLTGNVMDLESIGRITRPRGILLIVDAAQTAGNVSVDVERMAIDILCFTGHKSLLGPQGTGGIWLREGIELSPMKVGGSGVHSFDREHPKQMPTALEAGTLNVHGIAGLNAGLRFLEETGIEEIHRREMALTRRFVRGICEIPQIRIYGQWTHLPELEGENEAEEPDAIPLPLLTPIVSLNIGDMDSAEICDILWEDHQICVRGGAHCAPLMHRHFGTEEQGAVRFSFSYFNTEQDIDEAIAALKLVAEEEIDAS